jgi:hypothetical protein
LANGTSANLTIVVRINGTGDINNTVVVNTTENNTGDNNTTSNNTTVGPVINLTITKSVNATSALNCEYLTYIITVTNFGPDDAMDLNII